MKNLDDFKRMYGATPDSFQRRVALALKETEERPMKKFTIRTALVAAVILVLLMAAAYAAFSSQVTEFFGRLYGSDTKAWLEQGDVATANQSFTLDGAVFTLDEVVYRDNGLYGVGTIRPAEGGDAVLLPEDWEADAPFGYDIHGAGGAPEEAPADAPTYADTARERGGRLLVVRALPDQIGVDGGALLAPDSIGCSETPQRDGSIRYLFKVTDAVAVGEGTEYTLVMYASVCELTPEGEWLEDTRQRGSWTVTLRPEPMAAQTAGEAGATPDETAQADAPSQPGAYTVVAPDEYLQTGTMPVYRATARDFGADIRPELFNQSGVAETHESWLVYNDEAQLSWAPEAIFYEEYSGTYNGNYKEPELEPMEIPKNTLANEAANLAGWAMNGWPGTNEVYRLERDALTHITLREAQATLEGLLAQLGLEGYVCDYALDMSVERIRTLGREMNAMRESGEMGGNSAMYDYDAATPADEGFYLSYHKFGGESGLGNGDLFSVYAYVTERGVASAAIRDMYVPGETYATPDRLVEPQTVVDALPAAIAASRFPAGAPVSIQSVHLLYGPQRAENKADGMVLAPMWLVRYEDAESLGEDEFWCWAEFDAVTGELLNAIFK